MGDRIRSGFHDRRRPAAGAGALALLLLGGEALAQRTPAPREPVKGAIVQYEESPPSRILYLEESGGMVTQVTRPLPRDAGLDAAAAAGVSAKATLADSKAKADAAARRAAPRRSAAVPEAGTTRP
jgi:hypothetical protein